jgi:DNA-directed RNA polymerase subunit E'
MYVKIRAVDVVRAPPERLGDDLQVVVKEMLQEKLEGRLDKKIGIFIAILDIVDIKEGRIMIGDAGVYYETVFDALVFRPKMQEIVEGEVLEIVEFGAFVEIGPLDGLLHISQITDEYISYDEKNAKLVTKETGRTLGEGDKLRARIVAISLNERDPSDSKIGLTMRQPGLGKLEWIEEDRQKKKEEAETKAKEEKKGEGKEENEQRE